MPETHETQAAQQLHKPSQPNQKARVHRQGKRKARRQKRIPNGGGTSTTYGYRIFDFFLFYIKWKFGYLYGLKIKYYGRRNGRSG